MFMLLACARKKDMVNKNVLLIIKTSFYLENCHFGCYKTGRVRTCDFMVVNLSYIRNSSYQNHIPEKKLSFGY